MEIHPRHPWNLSAQAAIAIQQQLRAEVVTQDQFNQVRYVAGVDVGFDNALARAAVAVLRFPGLQLEAYAIATVPTAFPYVPGLLSFREVPAVLAALGQLAVPPDLLLCDGQGIAHPRRFGIASHLGVLTGIPAVGVAKSRLVGQAEEPADARGAWTPLTDRGDTIGAVLRTRVGVKPLYVSVGHRVSLTSAVGFVMACVTRYRLPETTRWAHRLASGSPAEIARALQRQGMARA